MSRPRRRDMRDPRRDHDTWEDRADDFEARPFWTIFKWGALSTLIVVALVAIVWALSVGGSDVQGRGNAVRQKNDATNRIQQSENFEETKQDFEAFPAKIKAAKRASDRANKSPDTTDDSIKATELDGIVQQCIDVAHDYNADARKYTAKDFRAADLPDHLDDNICTEASS